MELKRYVRTKNNYLIDFCKQKGDFIIEDEVLFEKDQLFGKTFFGIIAKTSDNILDIVEVGDLVQTDFYKSPLLVIEKGYDKKFHCSYLELTFFKFYLDKIEEREIIELYTKQGDNYILVARKTEKGWEVL